MNCLNDDPMGTRLYSGLGNANSEEVEARLKGKMAFLGAVHGGLQETVLLQQRRSGTESLVVGRKYR